MACYLHRDGHHWSLPGHLTLTLNYNCNNLETVHNYYKMASHGITCISTGIIIFIVF